MGRDREGQTFISILTICFPASGTSSRFFFLWVWHKEMSLKIQYSSGSRWSKYNALPNTMRWIVYHHWTKILLIFLCIILWISRSVSSIWLWCLHFCDSGKGLICYPLPSDFARQTPLFILSFLLIHSIEWDRRWLHRSRGRERRERERKEEGGWRDKKKAVVKGCHDHHHWSSSPMISRKIHVWCLSPFFFWVLLFFQRWVPPNFLSVSTTFSLL